MEIIKKKTIDIQHKRPIDRDHVISINGKKVTIHEYWTLSDDFDDAYDFNTTLEGDDKLTEEEADILSDNIEELIELKDGKKLKMD